MSFSFIMHNLSFLKFKLAQVNRQIEILEFKATEYSSRDREIMKKYDVQIALLKWEYLDLDDKIQTLEKANNSNDSVCLVDTTVTESANS